jgi:hypothetical protein
MSAALRNAGSNSFTVNEVYRQGSGVQNEDAIVCRPEIGLFAVIDGATALAAHPALSGAVAAQSVKAALERWDGSGRLIDAVTDANRYLGQVTGGEALHQTKRPSCCIAAVRMVGERLEFAQAGDCMAFVEYTGASGEAGFHRPPDVACADQETVPQAQAVAHAGASAAEAARSTPVASAHPSTTAGGANTGKAAVRALTHDSVARFDSHSVQMLMEAWETRRAAAAKVPDVQVPSGTESTASEENVATSEAAAECAPVNQMTGVDVTAWPVDKQLEVLSEIRAELRPVLARHREMMNVAGGYSVLDGSADAERFIEHGVINASLVSRVLLLSDGLQLPTSKFDKRTGQAVGQARGESGPKADEPGERREQVRQVEWVDITNGWLGTETTGWLDTATYAFSYGVDALCQRVLELEKEDPGCYIHPRLKPHDDKSGLLIAITS